MQVGSRVDRAILSNNNQNQNASTSFYEISQKPVRCEWPCVARSSEQRRDELNVICSVFCDYNHLYTPTSTHNLCFTNTNHVSGL